MIGRNKDGVLFYSVRYKDRMGVDVQKKEQNKDWKTKKEAKEAMDRFLLSVTGSIDCITLGQLYRLFVDDRAGRVKLRTAYAFDNVYNTHIKPTFEKAVISEIAPRHITTWQNDLKMKGYKNTYLLMIQEHLCRILNFGVRFGYIDKSPFVNRFAKDITQRKVEMTFWTIDEFNKFIQKIDNDTYYAFFMTLYWTGIRRGEAIALQIRDVNFTDNTLRISKTYDSVHKVTTTPKTSNSYRLVQMTSELKNTLSDIIAHDRQFDGCTDDSLLFGVNTPLAPESIKQRQIKAAEQAGVKIIKIHEFRHSHVSLLVSMGFSAFDIAKRMGHTVAMVENVYAHWFPSAQNEMIRKLDEAAVKVSIENTKRLA